MQRVALTLEYSGKSYHGWQHQPGLKTIQTTVEEAISKFTDEPIQVHCAGRTDTGVHALGQVIHFDTSARRSIKSWLVGVNNYLPSDIVVVGHRFVEDDFHARKSALSRSYQYFIYNSPVRSSVANGQVTWHHRQLDERKMHKAIQSLRGEHDFSSFRSSQCQSLSPVRKILYVDVRRMGALIRIRIKGNAFVHHMVRNITGVLMSIGSGKKPVSWCQEVLEARDRTMGDVTAPPHGLYLVEVQYDKALKIPRHRRLPNFSPMLVTDDQFR